MGLKFSAFPEMYSRFSYYNWSAPLPYCFSLSCANTKLLPSPQWPDLLAPNACGICDLYVIVYTHTHYTVSCFPLLPQTHPRDLAWTKYHTKACHVCCVCIYVCKCMCVSVHANIQEPGWSLLFWAGVCLSAVLHRRSETNNSPSTHTHTNPSSDRALRNWHSTSCK